MIQWMQITFTGDDRFIEVIRSNHAIIWQPTPHRYLFIIASNFFEFMRIFRSRNLYVGFVDISIFIKDTFVGKNAFKKGFIIHFFKLLYNVKSVRKQVNSVLDNSMNRTSRKTHTMFCYPWKCSWMSIERARYPLFIFRCYWRSPRLTLNFQCPLFKKDLNLS